MRKRFKQIICVALCFIMLFVLASCGKTGNIVSSLTSKKTTTPLTVGTLNQIENVADFSLIKIISSDKVQATMPGGLYYTTNNSSEQFVDIVLDYTNKSSQSITCDKIAVLKAESANGTAYTSALYAIETEGNQYVSQYESIAPLSTARLHCAVSVPKTETTLKISLEFDTVIYTYDYTVNSNVSNAITLPVGGLIDVPDYGKLIFKGTRYTDDLLPTNTSSSYRHYQIDNTANTYLVAEFEMTNYLANSKQIRDMISATAIYSGKYNYDGFVVMLEDDGTGFDSGFYNIDPLTTRRVYYLIEIPKTVCGTDYQLQVIFNNQEYVFTGK